MYKYCRVCGTQLHIQIIREGGFDMQTGKPMYFRRYHCPNKPGGLGGLFSGHISESEDGLYILTDDGKIDEKRGIVAWNI